MIKGGKRSVLIARLSASKDSIKKFQGKCRGLWLIIKQVWYMPFIWSLAWFSYWLFQESIVMGQQLTQGSTFNQIGLAISIVAILIAGCMSGKSGEKNIKKTEKVGIERKSCFNSFEALDGKNSAKSIPPRGIVTKTQSDKSEQRGEQSKNYPQIETNQIRIPNETSMTSFQTLDSTRNTHNKVNLSNQIKQPEIPSECLICPNLTSCDHRGKMNSESETPCPYAQDNY